jgi:two-component system chemotaxis sensor kinase CheA
MDNEEIVVKPCPKEFSFNPCYMGTTILGDGNLAAILDPEGIIRLAQLNFKNITSQEVKSVEKNSGFLDSVNSTNFLIFETGEGFRYGVPLSSVGKLERIHRSECQTRGGAELFQRDDRTLHLIKINQFINEVGTDPELEDVMYAIIPHGHEEHYAILATKIVDTIDVNSAARSYSSEGLGNIYLQARFALGDTLVLVPDVNAIIGALLKKGGKQ